MFSAVFKKSRTASYSWQPTCTHKFLYPSPLPFEKVSTFSTTEIKYSYIPWTCPGRITTDHTVVRKPIIYYYSSDNTYLVIDWVEGQTTKIYHWLWVIRNILQSHNFPSHWLSTYASVLWHHLTLSMLDWLISGLGFSGIVDRVATIRNYTV